MEKEPHEIRREILETREQLEHTVEAIAYKTDVGARAKDAVHHKVDAVKEAVGNALGLAQSTAGDLAQTAQSRLSHLSDATQAQLSERSGNTQMALDQARATVANAGASIRDMASSAQNAMPDMNQARGAVGQVKNLAGSTVNTISGNPLGLALGALAAGLLVGSLLPATTIEREQIGQLGDQLTETAKAKAGDVFEQGKAAVNQTVSQFASNVSGSGAQATDASDSSSSGAAAGNNDQAADFHKESGSSGSAAQNTQYAYSTSATPIPQAE